MENKNTENPFIPTIIEKWNEFISFEDFTISTIIEKITTLIVLSFLILLIPIGIVISIYSSLYNLQTKANEALSYHDDFSKKFAAGIEVGIYFILSLPFLGALIPYWFIASIVIFATKNKTLFIIITLLVISIYFFWDYNITNLFNQLDTLFSTSIDSTYVDKAK